ncbi:MAG: type IV secretory system conjugative DNA transfer family protein [Pseudomonadota bacterium]
MNTSVCRQVKQPNSVSTLFGCLLLLMATGCGAPKQDSVPPTANLSHLRHLDQNSTQAEKLTMIRYAALRDAGLSVGARGGLAARTFALNATLEDHAPELDRIFNFNRLILDNHVLPPVLLEGRQVLDLNDSQTFRISDRVYTVHSQAKFVSAAPTWRDYLIMDFPPPEEPDTSLLPRNKTEKQIWDRYVREGWAAGTRQAQVIYEENLGRLKRDLEGMIRYRSFLAQNMISAPFVATLEMGVTGDRDEMAVNDRLLRITELPGFQTDADQWTSQVRSLNPDVPLLEQKK